MSNLTNNTTKLQNLLTKINELPNISSGNVSLPTLTNQASSSDLRSGKQLIDGDGNIVEGNVATRYNSNVMFKMNGENIAVSVPAGIYDSDISKTLGAVKEAATYTPTTSNQIIGANTYLSGTQTILGDVNLNSANIKSGVSIFGINGTLETGWEKVQFILEGSGEASLSTDIYGNGVFYIDFASPISAFTGLSFIYEREDRSGYESYTASVIPGYSEGTYLGLYHNFDYGDEDDDGFVPGTYGDAVYDWGITASLTSSTRIKVDMNEIGNYLEDAGSRHYGHGVVFVKYS